MITPWYKQFWPWFLIILPVCVVIASFTTLAIFSHNSVSLVAEDYYKKGKAINQDLSRVKVAIGLQLDATIRSDENNIIIHFNKGELSQYPALNVIFTHRTLANHDFAVMLTADARGIYRYTGKEAISGPWFIQLEPHDKAWLIQGKVTFPSSSPVALVN